MSPEASVDSAGQASVQASVRASALALKDVRKAFRAGKGSPVQALDGISLVLRPGGLAALVGPDGAGKTTLLRIAAGLLTPDSGRLALFGAESGEALAAARASVGYMPQKFGLYEDLTIRENLDLYADLRGLPKKDREARYHELLSMTGLERFPNRLAGRLSGGMKQKLGLVCTLVKAPELLLLDEPTVGVDPLSRRELWEIIHTLTASSRMAVLVSTAYLDEAARCEDILLLFEGKPLAHGSPGELKKQSRGMAYSVKPENNDTARDLQARLLALPGIVDAVPQGGEVRLVYGDLDSGRKTALAQTLDGATPQRVKESLEDTFMLLLRGKKKASPEAAAHGAGENPAPAHGTNPETSRGNGHGGHEGPVIETRNVTRTFGDFIAVNNVSFSVNRGEVFGLLGPNGAGKTTTFRMLCGLLPPTSGSLFVAGVDVGKAREDARRRLGYVAQKFSLYGPLTVMENLDFFAGAYGLRGDRKDERIKAVVADFSLENAVTMAAEALPGGYKQRLAMAAGLLHEPEILFLDEPTSGADPLARREFWQRISALAAGGVTIIVTTHFMEEAEYCDRILIQDSGTMLALDTPANIRAKAGNAPSMEEAFITIVEQARKQNSNGEATHE